jgi:hypothetical protein
MSRELEKQLEKDLKRHRVENDKALPSWAKPKNKPEKKKKKGKK